MEEELGRGPGHEHSQETGAAPPEGARRPLGRMCTAPEGAEVGETGGREPEKLKWSKNQM